MQTIETLTINELREITKEAFEELGHADAYSDVDRVGFNSRLRSSGARVSGGYETVVEYNPKLPLDLIEQAAKHEAAHIITGEGDRSFTFRSFCIQHDIMLNLDEQLESEPDYKYIISCTECDTERKYKRKGKYIKRMEKYPDEHGLRCKCGSEELELVYLDR